MAAGNGDDGIASKSRFNLLNNRIVRCEDGIDYIDAGSKQLKIADEIVYKRREESYTNKAPDIGAFERGIESWKDSIHGL